MIGVLSRTAVIVGLLLLAGCGADVSPPDSVAPLALNVIAIPQLVEPPGAGTSQIRTLAVTIYDVTGNRFVRTSTLEVDSILPVLRDTAILNVETPGDTVIEKTYELPLGQEPRDFRVKVEVASFAEQETTRVAGTRTVVGLAAGSQASIDVYLSPADALPADLFGVQVADSWATPGQREHLIPIVLVNSGPIGGFQFDLSFSPSVIESLLDFEIDPDSRLYLERSESGIADIGTNGLNPSTYRVVVFSDNREGPIQPGFDVALYMRARLAPNAESDSVRLESDTVFISDSPGDSLKPVNALRNGFLTIDRVIARR